MRIPVLVTAFAMLALGAGVLTLTSSSAANNQVRAYAPQLARGELAPTATRTPTITPTVPSAATATPTVGPLACSASAAVNDANPKKNSDITLTATLSCTSGSPGGATMTSSWAFKTTTSGCSSTTAPNGVAVCTRSIGNASSGYTVVITVTLGKDGQTWTATTSFTPQ